MPKSRLTLDANLDATAVGLPDGMPQRYRSPGEAMPLKVQNNQPLPNLPAYAVNQGVNLTNKADVPGQSQVPVASQRRVKMASGVPTTDEAYEND